MLNMRSSIAGKSESEGTYVGSMASGDKFYIRPLGYFKRRHSTRDIKGYWEFTGGTGKLKGIVGTDTATGNENGREANMESEYSVPEKTDPNLTS